jgi:hypothetical protein
MPSPACGGFGDSGHSVGLQSVMFQSTSSKIAQQGNPSVTAAPPLLAVEAADAGDWIPDDAERQLAAELEKILALKPVQHAERVEPVTGPIAGDDDAGDDVAYADIDARSTPLQTAQRRLSGPLNFPNSEETEEGFEWQPPSGNGAHPETPSSADQTVSMQWVTKARSDRRHRAVRNAFGWVVTLIIGGAVLGGAAYLLMGWKPDIPSLLQIGQKFLS